MGAQKTASIVLISIILIAGIVGLVNVGSNIILDKPSYDDYRNESACQVTEDPKDICNYNYDTEAYEGAVKDYNQLKFYIFAGIGFLLLLVGLFVPEPITKFTGLGTGLVLVVQSLFFGWDNKIMVFFTIFGIVIIFGYLGIKKVKEMK